MMYISNQLKEKTFSNGINLISFEILPFENANICIILVHEKDCFVQKIYANSFDIDYYNNILLTYLHGKELINYFPNLESVFLSIKKRFPNHFKR